MVCNHLLGDTNCKVKDNHDVIHRFRESKQQSGLKVGMHGSPRKGRFSGGDRNEQGGLVSRKRAVGWG